MLPSPPLGGGADLIEAVLVTPNSRFDRLTF